MTAGTTTVFVARRIVTLNPAQPEVEASVQAELPMAWLGTALYRPHGGGLLPTAAANHDRRFEAWAVRPDGCFDAHRLRAWLQALPAGVLRLKGQVKLANTGPPAWADLPFAGRHAALPAIGTRLR